MCATGILFKKQAKAAPSNSYLSPNIMQISGFSFMSMFLRSLIIFEVMNDVSIEFKSSLIE